MAPFNSRINKSSGMLENGYFPPEVCVGAARCLFPSRHIDFFPSARLSASLTFQNVPKVPASLSSDNHRCPRTAKQRIVPSAAGWGGILGSLTGTRLNPKWERHRRSNGLPHFNLAQC